MEFNYQSGDAHAEINAKQEPVNDDAAAIFDLNQIISNLLDPVCEHFSNVKRCLTSQRCPSYFDKTLQHIANGESILNGWNEYKNNKFIPNLKSKTALFQFFGKKAERMKSELEKLLSEAMTTCCKDGLETSRERLDFWRFNSFPSHSAYVQAQALNLYMEMYSWYFSTWLNVLDNTTRDSMEEFCKKVSEMQDKDATFQKNTKDVISPKPRERETPEGSISQDSLVSELSDNREFQDCSSTMTEDSEEDNWNNFNDEQVSSDIMACAESQTALDKATQKYQAIVVDLVEFERRLKSAVVRATDQVFAGPYESRRSVFHETLEPEFREIKGLVEEFRKRQHDGETWDAKVELENANKAEVIADMEKMNCISRVKLTLRVFLYYFYSDVIDHLGQYMTAANIIHKGLQKYDMTNQMNSMVDNTMCDLGMSHDRWIKELRQHMTYLCEGKMRMVTKLEQTEAFFKGKVQDLSELFLRISQNARQLVQDRSRPMGATSGCVRLRTSAKQIFF